MYICTWLALIASGIAPFDRFTWVLEVSWVFAGLIMIPIFRAKKVRMTPLLKILIYVHALILIYGGIYTYERVPLGEWMRCWFSFERNHYDRIGHFMQGFVPAILAREVLIRKKVINGKFWTHFMVFCICVAFSALFELLEFAAAMAFASGADNYLGSQGDIWDAQWDITFCGIGCVLVLLSLSGLHNRQMEKLESATAKKMGKEIIEQESKGIRE
jgi:putative membrane protein